MIPMKDNELCSGADSFISRYYANKFAKSGLNLSEGCIMAITYITEMIDAGAFTISKAGVQDVRNRNM